MHTPDGKIAVEGFYDDVVPLSAEDRARLAATPFDEAAYTARLGIDEVFGEPGYTPQERVWTRPTLEVNGMWGGFQGQGIKTVIPREAYAKITCRLVADQDPAKIVRLLQAHVEKHKPKGVKALARPESAVAWPVLVPVAHPGNQAVRAVLEEIYGREACYTMSGGSVAANGIFLRLLGAYSIGLGFSLNDEQSHAPDEFFRLASFERGQAAYCRLLEKLGESS